MTRRWTLRLAAGLVAAMASLSGCSERQEANDTLPGADASPSATEPELLPLGPPDLPMPAEARTPDAAGAEAFVRYYIDLINRTSTVMDAAPLREFSAGCADCDRIAADTENDAAAGYRYEGGEIAITATGTPLVESATAEMAFIANQAALRVIDSAGRPVPNLSFEAFSNFSSGASAQWRSKQQTWVITGLTLG